MNVVVAPGKTVTGTVGLIVPFVPALGVTAKVVHAVDGQGVDNAGRPLLNETLRAFENFPVAHASTAAHEDGNARGRFNDLVIHAHVIRRVSLDDVRAEFHGLTDQVHDLHDIAVNHIATGLRVRLKHERLHHHRHAVEIGLRFEFRSHREAGPGPVRRDEEPMDQSTADPAERDEGPDLRMGETDPGRGWLVSSPLLDDRSRGQPDGRIRSLLRPQYRFLRCA